MAKRFTSIDVTRGLVMIIMALDHTRDLMHKTSITEVPTNLATATMPLFLTRWITHLCAPIFVFLAGTSVYLLMKKQNNVRITQNHLIKRGLWLIFIEFTLVNFGIWFDLGFHTFLFQVIAVIGLGFLLLAAFIRISYKWIGLIGITIILFHNALVLIPFREGSVLQSVLLPFFSTTVLPLSKSTILVIGYPVVPWLGIMFSGFFAGHLFEFPENRRRILFLKIGTGLIFFFIILRIINIYGDPAPWSYQKNTIFTFLSFINVTKYPPSLLFSLITLGIMFIFLSIAEKFSNQITGILNVYGRVPFFYYIVHWYIIHPFMIILMLLQGFGFHQLSFANGHFGRPDNTESGFDLWIIYLIWLLVVVLLYFPCKWFSKYKMEHQNWWLKYL
ncbi:MAG: heparan-alpha-glucosaminide N-acetyltransferase domain-containing protein [Bacteroidales bacterium]